MLFIVNELLSVFWLVHNTKLIDRTMFNMCIFGLFLNIECHAVIHYDLYGVIYDDEIFKAFEVIKMNCHSCTSLVKF